MAITQSKHWNPRITGNKFSYNVPEDLIGAGIAECECTVKFVCSEKIAEQVHQDILKYIEGYVSDKPPFIQRVSGSARQALKIYEIKLACKIVCGGVKSFFKKVFGYADTKGA